MTFPAAHEVDEETRPLRIILFGSQFAAVDDSEAMGFSASGPSCLATLAQRLLQSGYAPQQTLSLHRGGQHIGRVSLAAAANNPDMEKQE
jgi:hypothetical protein